jgi:hypothetical protein
LGPIPNPQSPIPNPQKLANHDQKLIKYIILETIFSREIN